MRILSFLICFILVSGLQAQESIHDYQVEITILPDSKIEVTEKITVRAEGYQIKRGIFRSIPTIRPDKAGRNEPAPIDILKVTRDGQPEKYHTEKSRQNVTIYFGEESVILSPGVYIYEFTYRASNQIGYFEDYDELYWNVIGADWSFPIQEYSVTIHLPDGADYLQGACYTGRPGSTSSDCMISAAATEGDVLSRSDKGLSPGEGFTVAVAWPKGFVEEGSTRSYSLNWINAVLYGIGLLFFLFFGYRLWNRVGVDPPAVAVFPDWHPPGEYSPAEISYLHNHRITNTAISSALVSGAIKGAIRIENKKKKFTFLRVGSSDNLEEEERVLIDRLLPEGAEYFELKSSTYSTYDRAKNAFTSALQNKLDITDYFRSNWKQAALGTMILAVVTTAALTAGMYSLLNSTIVAVFLTFMSLMMIFGIISIPFRIGKWYKWLIIIPVLLLMMGVFTGLFTQVFFYSTDYIPVAVSVGVSTFLAGMYNYLIYAPTPKGQETSAAVKGFRMYLDKSEKAILEYFTPPEKTPELFEKLLPFAIALGVENSWGKKFKQVLDQAIEQGTYAPIWYVGNIHQINSLHSNFQSSVSQAAPKSSSGSGGGGFSGGGGGGGGGGGW